MKTTLQEQYNKIRIGNNDLKPQFLKHARTLFPEYFNQYTDFDTAVNVLKSKQIISEAAGGVVAKGFDIYDWKKILFEEKELKIGESVKATEKETSKEVLDDQKNAYDNNDMKNADNVNFNEIMKGFYAELGDEKNAGKTGDEIKAIVVKNLAKDPLFYTKDGMFGVKDLGFTDDIPSLGEPKEAKGKHKSSGYGDLKENKINKTITENINKKYAYFAIRKSDNKIVDGWEIVDDVESLKYYAKLDLKDNDLDPKDHNIVSRKFLISKGINPFDPNNWYKIGESIVNENEDIYQQLEDLQNELMSETDPERKKEIENKIKTLESGLDEAMYQTPVSIGKNVKGDGERKPPRALFLDKSSIDAINKVQPGSIKLISKDSNQIYMYVSNYVKNALDELGRGRTTMDKLKKQTPLADVISDKWSSLIRGKVKKELNPKLDPSIKMHFVDLNIVPSKKSDRPGYWILLSGDFESLVTEKLRPIVREVIMEILIEQNIDHE